MDNTINQEEYNLPRFRTVLFGYSKQDIVEYLNSISSDVLNVNDIKAENKMLKAKLATIEADLKAKETELKSIQDKIAAVKVSVKDLLIS